MGPTSLPSKSYQHQVAGSQFSSQFSNAPCSSTCRTGQHLLQQDNYPPAAAATQPSFEELHARLLKVITSAAATGTVAITSSPTAVPAEAVHPAALRPPHFLPVGYSLLRNSSSCASSSLRATVSQVHEELQQWQQQQQQGSYAHATAPGPQCTTLVCNPASPHTPTWGTADTLAMQQQQQQQQLSGCSSGTANCHPHGSPSLAADAETGCAAAGASSKRRSSNHNTSPPPFTLSSSVPSQQQQQQQQVVGQAAAFLDCDRLFVLADAAVALQIEEAKQQQQQQGLQGATSTSTSQPVVAAAVAAAAVPAAAGGGHGTGLHISSSATTSELVEAAAAAAAAAVADGTGFTGSDSMQQQQQQQPKTAAAGTSGCSYFNACVAATRALQQQQQQHQRQLLQRQHSAIISDLCQSDVYARASAAAAAAAASAPLEAVNAAAANSSPVSAAAAAAPVTKATLQHRIAMELQHSPLLGLLIGRLLRSKHIKKAAYADQAVQADSTPGQQYTVVLPGICTTLHGQQQHEASTAENQTEAISSSRAEGQTVGLHHATGGSSSSSRADAKFLHTVLGGVGKLRGVKLTQRASVELPAGTLLVGPAGSSYWTDKCGTAAVNSNVAAAAEAHWSQQQESPAVASQLQLMDANSHPDSSKPAAAAAGGYNSTVHMDQSMRVAAAKEAATSAAKAAAAVLHRFNSSSSTAGGSSSTDPTSWQLLGKRQRDLPVVQNRILGSRSVICDSSAWNKIDHTPIQQAVQAVQTSHDAAVPVEAGGSVSTVQKVGTACDKDLERLLMPPPPKRQCSLKLAAAAVRTDASAADSHCVGNSSTAVTVQKNHTNRSAAAEQQQQQQHGQRTATAISAGSTLAKSAAAGSPVGVAAPTFNQLSVVRPDTAAAILERTNARAQQQQQQQRRLQWQQAVEQQQLLAVAAQKAAAAAAQGAGDQ